MKVSYGPRGHQGVVSLMAVGDADYASPCDQTVKTGSYVAAGVAVLGMLTGSKTLRNAGGVAALALWGVRALTKPPKQALPLPTSGPSFIVG